MRREVEPELLDRLRPDDPRAIKSRRDIALLNSVMGHAGLVAKIWTTALAGDKPRHIVELGGGDGKLLLSIARRMPSEWEGTRVTLLDLQPCVSVETEAELKKLGWRLDVVPTDIHEWFEQQQARYEAVMANLVLHHFSYQQLTRLFGQIAQRTDLFTAFEPRRAVHALACSHMVGMIGCGPVTRNDAPVSVRAGFSVGELSELWPRAAGWKVQEKAVGLFSHAFVAQKVAGDTGKRNGS
jgi:hypothetical protein